MSRNSVSARWRRCVLLGLIGWIVAVALGSAWHILSYSDFGETTQAHAAIVLGAAVWGDQPSPVFQERIKHAIALYKSERVHTIIFTGGRGEGDELAEATVARSYAIAHGVPESAILTETVSHTTYQNLHHAHRVARAHHLTSFLVVSDPLHMRRAVLMARDMGMDAFPSPTPTTRYRSWRTRLRFLVRETYFYVLYLLRRPLGDAVARLPTFQSSV